MDLELDLGRGVRVVEGTVTPELGDVLRSRCPVIPLLMHEGDSVQKVPTRVLLRNQVARGMRDQVLGYVVKYFGSRGAETLEDEHFGPLDVWYGARLGKTYIDIVVTDDVETYMVGAADVALAVYKAQVQGLDVAHVLRVGRSQGELVGTTLTPRSQEAWEALAEAVQDVLDRALDGSIPGVRSVCGVCSLRDACTVGARAERYPWQQLIRNAVRQSPDATLVEGILAALPIDRPFRTGKVISPSDVSTHPCDRKLVYRLLGTEPRGALAASLIRTFETGHVVHDAIQYALSQVLPDFEAEVRVAVERLRIRGTTDGRFADGSLLEIKSISDSGFSLGQPKQDHVAQLDIYLRAADASSGYFLYYNKKTGNVKVFRTRFDSERFKKIDMRARRVLRFAERGALPPRTEGYHCTKCPYGWTCSKRETSHW
jgi:CRISPR/Cas system-associated exonuclease Cas4 (RecB family)